LSAIKFCSAGVSVMVGTIDPPPLSFALSSPPVSVAGVMLWPPMATTESTGGSPRVEQNSILVEAVGAFSIR